VTYPLEHAEQAVGPHQFVRFLTGPDATPRDTCHCGRDLFDPAHPAWPPTDLDEEPRP
jgi:hypothetical protein